MDVKNSNKDRLGLTRGEIIAGTGSNWPMGTVGPGLLFCGIYRHRSVVPLFAFYSVN